ncbi:barstar family protein [Streptomyces sp. NBC_01142]|uniref:barstar family protein n=1 Tax=Streptomyces sp. NBC_01142 TaxID=2975865 RepID=UPI0022512114|nr:barstar family protein [Streptomyces sp. NBC_01142]MCX4821987.1 barstar family protein [Streptomyces sp. NBC_01142]
MVIIDVSAARDGRQLHAALSQALGFPAFYGMNWDAFWDAITGLVVMPDHVRFLGWDGLAEHLPREAEALRASLDRYQHQYRAQFVAEYR